jgi:hypothetical protein
MVRRGRKRGRLKWVMLGVTVLLALACGPWSVTYVGPRVTFAAGGALIHVQVAKSRAWPEDFPITPVWRWEFRRPTSEVLLGCWHPGRFVSDSFVRMYQLSLWIPLVLAVTATLLIFARDRQRRVPSGHCPNCDYELTGNVSGVCPECGERV